MVSRLFAVAALAMLLGLAAAQACAPAMAPDTPVAIADESAIIIWDAGSRTEHFIRRASFTTPAKDFGFLVPTPTQPTLAEVKDEPFETLTQLTAPEVVQRTRPTNINCGCGMVADRFESATAGHVQVLDSQRLAGYDAVVLKADDVDALSAWLKKNGYEFPPNLQTWADHYIKAGWVLTAFKIARQPEAQAAEVGPQPETVSLPGGVATSAVRMSFQTDRPFYPYMEPAAKDGEKANLGSRLLRVFFLSDTRVHGTLGVKDGWPGKTVWAGQLSEADTRKVREQLQVPGPAAAAWYLTEFEDHSSPRPGHADVFYAKADEQQPVRRQPHNQYVSSPVPLDPTGYALVGAMVLPTALRCLRRRAS